MAVLFSKIPIIGYYFLTPAQQSEYNVHRYIRLFHQALEQGRPLPDESQQVEQLAHAMRSPVHTPAAVRACEELVWMSEVSKFPEYVRAEKTQEGYRLKILPKALELHYNRFCAIALPLVNGKNYPVVIGDKEYTSRAVAHGLGCQQLKSLQDFTETSHCRFRDEKKGNWTVAQIRSLGLQPDVNLSDVEESVFTFVYEAFVDGRHLELAWWNQYTHDEFFRLQSFVKKFTSIKMTEFDKGQLIVRVAEDRLLLKPKQFQKEMRAFLEFYNTASVIQIEQSNSSYPLVFRREKFKQLVEAEVDPQRLRATYLIKTCDEEETAITSDVFYQVLTFLSERGGPNWNPTQLYQINHTKETLDHAIQYVKTLCLPLLTWEDQRKLRDFLKECAPLTNWEKAIQDEFIPKEPYLSVYELELYQWSDLAAFLEPYKANDSLFIHLGPYVYTIKTLKQLIQNAPQIPVSQLAKTAWFEFNGKKIHGSLSVLQFWPELLDEYPTMGTGEAHNPIQFPNDAKLFKTYQPSDSLPMLQALQAFMQVIGQFFDLEAPLSDLESKLQTLNKIYIGDRNKSPRDYWRHVQEELSKYPQAKEIVLDGCTTTWPRETISLFCERGILTIEDLNTPLLLTLGADNGSFDGFFGRFVPVYRQIWQAEWKCLSCEDSAIDRSGKTNAHNRIPSKDFRVVYAAVFNKKKFDNLNEIRPSLKMLSPFALKKIFPEPAPQPRVLLTETQSFYAQRVLAIFLIALGCYTVRSKYVSNLNDVFVSGIIGCFVFTALGIDSEGRKDLYSSMGLHSFKRFALYSPLVALSGAAAGIGIIYTAKYSLRGLELMYDTGRSLIDRTLSVISTHFPLQVFAKH